MNRVQKEKVQITENIKKMKELHEQYDERIEELEKKYLATCKEKTMLKLEKDKLNNKSNDFTKKIKDHEDKVSKEI